MTQRAMNDYSEYHHYMSLYTQTKDLLIYAIFIILYKTATVADAVLGDCRRIRRL